jgi:catechol 2,3-dioxygenase-like lactoylglutathione lyase family enzyme
MKSHFILYVADQKRSTEFYADVLSLDPILEVPGMTEFRLSKEAILGLMPASSAKRLLGFDVRSSGTAAVELYLIVDSPGEFHARALAAGGEEISPPLLRDWGHSVSYCLDPDGHVVAFAKAD